MTPGRHCLIATRISDIKSDTPQSSRNSSVTLGALMSSKSATSLRSTGINGSSIEPVASRR